MFIKKIASILVASTMLISLLSTTNSIVSLADQSVNPAPALDNGYTESMPLTKTISNFEYGLDAPYDGVANRSPHYWLNLTPQCNYTPITPTNGNPITIQATTVSGSDNSNYWYIYPAANGSKTGQADAIYRLYAPNQTNYSDFSQATNFRVNWTAINPDNSSVSMHVYIYTQCSSPGWLDLGTLTSTSGTNQTSSLSLTSFTSTQLSKISDILFRTYNANLGTRTDGSSYQRTDIFNIDVYNPTTVKSDAVINNVDVSSEYLGNMMETRYGAYSASGFYDSDDQKWKLWYGGGIPEGPSADNIYYINTTDPKKGWSLPQRLIINDPNHILVTYNTPPGYGGDPSVIKVNGIYYMYFSAIFSHISPTYWYNKIYLATSTDGINYSLYNQPIVNCTDGGIAGYGSGGPSIVYKDGLYYLYYYTQNEATAGCYRRVSTDGYNFGASVLCKAGVDYDVKYVDSLNKWVGTYYSVQNQEMIPQSARARLAFSDDGINWTDGMTDAQMPSQENTSSINHNPGLIGDQYGHGYSTMFLTYGINDLPLDLPDDGGNLQYDYRQLGWSRISLSNWFGMSGYNVSSQSNTTSGKTMQGSGQQALFDYFYSKKLSSVNGFSSTILINSIAKTNSSGVHDTYLGIQFGSVMDPSLVFSNSAPGMMLVIKPDATANTYDTSLLSNDGTGETAQTLATITLAQGGAINLKLYTDSTAVWHLLLNGVDTGSTFSAGVSTMLRSGAYFGVKAYENISTYAYEQAVNITVNQVNNLNFGGFSNILSTSMVKSSQSNVYASSTANFINGGIQLTGKATASVPVAFKYALGSPVKNLNGFSTTFCINQLDGYCGVNGVANNIDFALTTVNATSASSPPQGSINSGRMDIWDYYNNPVTNARGVELRLNRTSDSSLNTQLFIIGSDGQFTIPSDVISSIAAAFSNNEITISLVQKGINWDVLVNGASILTGTSEVLNSELNAISTYGATPAYVGSYDNLGTPAVNGNISLTVQSIFGQSVGNYCYPINAAMFGTATSSTTLSGYPASKAIDGDGATCWYASNANMPQWLTVDLGSTYQILNIGQIFPDSASWKFSILISNDNINWTTIIDNTTTAVTGTDFAYNTNVYGRYVKLNITDGAGNYAESREFSVIGVPAINQALNKTATSSTNLSGYPASYAVDGTSNCWYASSSSMPQWLTVDLGSTYQIENVGNIFPNSASWKFRIDVSNDNSNWITIIDNTGTAVSGTTFAYNVNAYGRYARLYVTDGAGNWASSVEFSVYGVPAMNMALNKTAASSTNLSGYPASYAVDGTSNCWYASSSSMPQWLNVDLGNTYQITNVGNIFPNSASWKYRIDVSIDDTNWTTIVDNTGIAVSGTAFANNVNAYGRYVRLYVTDGGGNWASCIELTVYSNGIK